MNLILFESGEVDAAGGVRLAGPRARHLRGVLKVTRGQRLRVGILDGPFGHAEVLAAEDDWVFLRCAFDSLAPPRPPVDVLLAVPRPKVLRRLWAQLAALGVGRILLTNAERVERNYFDTHLLAPDGYRPLLIEGLQQARDTHLPVVSVHRRFRVLVEDELDALAGGACRLVADPSASMTPAAALADGGGDRVLLAIGPEGGWNRFELTLLEGHGFRAVGMGPRTLRTDTASIALLALAHDALRDAGHRPVQGTARFG